MAVQRLMRDINPALGQPGKAGARRLSTETGPSRIRVRHSGAGALGTGLGDGLEGHASLSSLPCSRRSTALAGRITALRTQVRQLNA